MEGMKRGKLEGMGKKKKEKEKEGFLFLVVFVAEIFS